MTVRRPELEPVSEDELLEAQLDAAKAMSVGLTLHSENEALKARIDELRKKEHETFLENSELRTEVNNLKFALSALFRGIDGDEIYELYDRDIVQAVREYAVKLGVDKDGAG